MSASAARGEPPGSAGRRGSVPNAADAAAHRTVTSRQGFRTPGLDARSFPESQRRGAADSTGNLRYSN